MKRLLEIDTERKPMQSKDGLSAGCKGAEVLVWMVQDRSGFLHDLRQASREVQEEAYRRGLIPIVPGEPPNEETGREER